MTFFFAVWSPNSIEDHPFHSGSSIFSKIPSTSLHTHFVPKDIISLYFQVWEKAQGIVFNRTPIIWFIPWLIFRTSWKSSISPPTFKRKSVFTSRAIRNHKSSIKSHVQVRLFDLVLFLNQLTSELRFRLKPINYGSRKNWNFRKITSSGSKDRTRLDKGNLVKIKLVKLLEDASRRLLKEVILQWNKKDRPFYFSFCLWYFLVYFSPFISAHRYWQTR